MSPRHQRSQVPSIDAARHGGRDPPGTSRSIPADGNLTALCYFFGAGLCAAAAFFCAFCFLVLDVFFGLLSPIALSFPRSGWHIDTNATVKWSH
jgi:hypothetical protein